MNHDVIWVVLLVVCLVIVGHIKANPTVLVCDLVALKNRRRGLVDKLPPFIDSILT